MLQQIDPEKGMRQRHAARGGLFQELAFLEPICSRNSTPPSITRPAAKSASSRAGADSSSGITRRSSAFARERKPMPVPSVHASMLSRVPAGTSAMSCLFLISHGTHSARSASSSFFAFCASFTRSTRPLPPPFRSAVVRSSRWRRRRPSGRHPSSKPSDNAASPSTASLRRPVPEIFIACHPSSSCNPCQIPQKRGPARAKRSGQTHETAWSSWPFADSIEEVVSYGCPLSVEGSKTSIRRLFWNRTCLHYGAPPPLAATAPSLQNSPDIDERARQPRVFRAWKESSRTSRESPAGITPMSVPFSARWARKNGICRSIHSRKGSARPQTGSALSHIPICRRQAFMCAISPKASFPPAVSVARYRQIAWPQASPSSA